MRTVLSGANTPGVCPLINQSCLRIKSTSHLGNRQRNGHFGARIIDHCVNERGMLEFYTDGIARFHSGGCIETIDRKKDIVKTSNMENIIL